MPPTYAQKHHQDYSRHLSILQQQQQHTLIVNLSENGRRAICLVNVWCRRTDVIVDAPRDNNDDMLYDLLLWEMRLEQLWQSCRIVNLYNLFLFSAFLLSLGTTAVILGKYLRHQQP